MPDARLGRAKAQRRRPGLNSGSLSGEGPGRFPFKLKPMGAHPCHQGRDHDARSGARPDRRRLNYSAGNMSSEYRSEKSAVSFAFPVFHPT
jgi:hypothetical protein